ncbi:hypothetical protein Q8A73_006912 [Channa argus]|nr:hypothetical protein Q8A73_006912 [Channa argus]
MSTAGNVEKTRVGNQHPAELKDPRLHGQSMALICGPTVKLLAAQGDACPGLLLPAKPPLIEMQLPVGPSQQDRGKRSVLNNYLNYSYLGVIYNTRLGGEGGVKGGRGGGGRGAKRPRRALTLRNLPAQHHHHHSSSSSSSPFFFFAPLEAENTIAHTQP